MTATARRRVVAGFDGSAHAAEAVQAAADEAVRRDAGLHLVHGLGMPVYAEVLLEPGTPTERLPWRVVAERELREVAAGVEATHPGLVVTTCVGSAAGPVLLLQESVGAELLVVGARGGGGFAPLSVGSVSSQVAAHAPCPVLVVRATERQEGPVVVGIDGSASCDRAVGFAFEEAAGRAAPLLAVHLYMPWAYDASEGVAPDADEYDAAEEHALVSEGIAGWREKYPDVKTDTLVLRRHAANGLVEAGAQAQLLVVGSRGLGGFRGLLLGSVSRAVLLHAPCTVAVVRGSGRE